MDDPCEKQIIREKKKRTTDDQETRKKGMEINNSLF